MTASTSNDNHHTFPIINGGLMASYVGKNVSLMGRFESVEGGGRLMKMKSTDEQFIIAPVTSPLSGSIEVGSFVQLQGLVENRNKIKPSSVRIIPSEICADFDAGMWNEMIGVMIENPELVYDDYNDMSEHFGVDEVSADGSNADIIPFNRSAEASGGQNGTNAAGEDQFTEMENIF